MYERISDSSDSLLKKDQSSLPCKRWKQELGMSFSMSSLHDHDCLLAILEFLSWEDLNSFSLSSKECCEIRGHSSLDQTRSGTIALGKGVSNAIELMEKVRERQWSEAFSGHRTHLRLSGLTHLSSKIDSLDSEFINNASPLKEVTSLDCSIQESCPSRPWLSRFEDYVDSGLAHGLTLSLLVPHLRQIDMSYLPLTLLGVAWILENNPNLEVLRWNHAVIWPINVDTCEYLRTCANLKEVYLDGARMLFCDDVNQDQYLWTAFSEYSKKLEKVSLRGTRRCHKGKLSTVPQESLMKFVRCTPSLQWFRSDLSPANVAILKKERPEIAFCS
jgi:hypothetical protein